jgi:hypothetical protein
VGGQPGRCCVHARVQGGPGAAPHLSRLNTNTGTSSVWWGSVAAALRACAGGKRRRRWEASSCESMYSTSASVGGRAVGV